MGIRFVAFFVIGSAVAFFMGPGCSTQRTAVDHAGTDKTCIQGTVKYMNPVSAAWGPYGNAAVTAWQPEKDRALVETKTDKEGNYCIEVPLGGPVDLRVWGLERFERTNFICEGSVSNIDAGSISKACGAGNCLKVDITVQCRERVERVR